MTRWENLGGAITTGPSRDLLDRFIPEYDLELTETLVVDALPAVTYAALGTLRATDVRSRSLRALVWLRGLPARCRAHTATPDLEDVLLGEKWVLLGEEPGRQIVLGGAGRFWTPLMTWQDIDAMDFAVASRSCDGVVVMSFAVDPHGRNQSLLSVAIRGAVTDTTERRWARWYWWSVKPAARYVARQLLRTVRDRTTLDQRSLTATHSGPARRHQR